MKPDKNKITKDINVAKEHIGSKDEKTNIEDITESLDNSPIWPAENEKEVTEQALGCKAEVKNKG